MQPGQPSRTAFAAAVHRAVHQVLDGWFLFSDPLAMRILGEGAEEFDRGAEDQPPRRRMRMFIAARTRYAEDSLAAAVERGARQLVVLGAGLDTFAYRSRFGDRLRIFEVDHPATQAWKRQRLQEVGIALPAWLTFAPIDFERESLAGGLALAGFDAGQPSFFTWLGVVPYLSQEAIWSTLRFIAGLDGGSQVVFDYGNPPASFSDELRAEHEVRAARVARAGEAFLSYFERDELTSRLREAGFSEIEDLGPREIVARYFPGRPLPGSGSGGHVVRAATVTPDRRVSR